MSGCTVTSTLGKTFNSEVFTLCWDFIAAAVGLHCYMKDTNLFDISIANPYDEDIQNISQHDYFAKGYRQEAFRIFCNENHYRITAMMEASYTALCAYETAAEGPGCRQPTLLMPRRRFSRLDLTTPTRPTKVPMTVPNQNFPPARPAYTMSPAQLPHKMSYAMPTHARSPGMENTQHYPMTANQEPAIQFMEDLRVKTFLAEHLPAKEAKLQHRSNVSNRLSWDGKPETFFDFKLTFEGALMTSGIPYMLNATFRKNIMAGIDYPWVFTDDSRLMLSLGSLAQYRLDQSFLYGAILQSV